MKTLAVLLGLAILVGYPALGIYCAKKSWVLSEGLPKRWHRKLVVSGVLSVFFAPAIAASGHGAAIAPAWLVLIDRESNSLLITYALISLPSTCTVFFIASLIIGTFRK